MLGDVHDVGKCSVLCAVRELDALITCADSLRAEATKTALHLRDKHFVRSPTEDSPSRAGARRWKRLILCSSNR